MDSSYFIGVGVGVLLVWMYIKLSSLYPNKTLIELNEAILGKWLGKFVSLYLSLLLFFLQSSFVLRGLVSNNSHYYSNAYACCSYFVYGNCDCRRSAWH
ncbi:GerAB/ArcD/ProY family transporter [Priestia megaterium]